MIKIEVWVFTNSTFFCAKKWLYIEVKWWTLSFLVHLLSVETYNAMFLLFLILVLIRQSIRLTNNYWNAKCETCFFFKPVFQLIRMAFSKSDQKKKEPKPYWLIQRVCELQILILFKSSCRNFCWQTDKVSVIIKFFKFDLLFQVMRLFQYLTMVLMSTYHHAELTRTASVSALHDLFHVIISILLEPKMEQLADGTQLLRALNVLTVKIIDRSNHTNIMSAIVKLLSDAVANSSVNPKFAETVMKCMWKIIRLLPIWMDDEAAQALDIDIVLCDLHEFLKTYPPSYWKKQESDTPLRTVKTVLHAMVKVSLTIFF